MSSSGSREGLRPESVLAPRWTRLWRALEAKGDPEPPFQDLVRRHAEPKRAYHTLEHVLQCLDTLEELRSQARDPDLMEAALWYHDAVYVPRAADNEARSAALAVAVLGQAGLAGERLDRLSRLILATRHTWLPEDPDEQLVVDIDLSILGHTEPVFDAYERGIREEYSWVPRLVFAKRRARLLASLLERPQLYATPALRERFEEQARRNLRRSIAALGGGGPGA